MFASGVIYRLAAEMSVPVRAQEILPGGQSADLASPHYADQYGRWLTQRYRPLPMTGATSVQGQAFEPRGSGR
jgi:acyl-homoserine lactone acylase PvdQ